MEMNAVPLIYSHPERGSGGSVAIVSNDRYFKMLADCSRQQIGSNI